MVDTLESKAEKSASVTCITFTLMLGTETTLSDLGVIRIFISQRNQLESACVLIIGQIRCVLGDWDLHESKR